MTIPESLTVAAVLISAANFVVLLATFRRAGQWKDSEDAKKLIDRVAACEGAIVVVKGAGEVAQALGSRMGTVETDITGLKTRMENVATKADVARLTAEVVGVERGLSTLETRSSRIEGGVDRIEGILMRLGPPA